MNLPTEEELYDDNLNDNMTETLDKCSADIEDFFINVCSIDLRNNHELQDEALRIIKIIKDQALIRAIEKRVEYTEMERQEFKDRIGIIINGE